MVGNTSVGKGATDNTTTNHHWEHWSRAAVGNQCCGHYDKG
jgi:hypothetical protein